MKKESRLHYVNRHSNDGKVVVFMKNNTKQQMHKGSSMDNPLPEPDIKITYKGELLWRKTKY